MRWVMVCKEAEERSSVQGEEEDADSKGRAVGWMRWHATVRSAASSSSSSQGAVQYRTAQYGASKGNPGPRIKIMTITRVGTQCNFHHAFKFLLLLHKFSPIVSRCCLARPKKPVASTAGGKARG